MRLCLLIACLLAACASAGEAKTRACQAINYTVSKVYPGMGHVRVTYRIFFATNNAVQMYSLVRSSHNQEVDHTALLQLQKLYGLEFVNAPPLRIVSYKKKTADLSVPDRAVDSCGRTTYFH